MRVWIDGVRVIDAWRDGTRETSATVALTAGRRHEIRVQYYENAGRAKATLAWSSDSQARETVPRSALRPPG